MPQTKQERGRKRSGRKGIGPTSLVDQASKRRLTSSGSCAPRKISDTRKTGCIFCTSPRKVARFADSPGRLHISVEQAVKVSEGKTASERTRCERKRPKQIDTYEIKL